MTETAPAASPAPAAAAASARTHAVVRLMRHLPATLLTVVAILIVMVCGIQWIGDRLVTRLDKRNMGRNKPV